VERKREERIENVHEEQGDFDEVKEHAQHADYEVVLRGTDFSRQQRFEAWRALPRLFPRSPTNRYILFCCATLSHFFGGRKGILTMLSTLPGYSRAYGWQPRTAPSYHHC
jgi:hypothetical protein